MERLESRQLLSAVDFLSATVVDNGGQGVPAQVATGDVNGDGRMDVVSVGNRTTYSGSYGTVNVYLGQANGSLQITNNYSAGNNRFHSPQLIDLTGDGKLDLLMGDSAGGTVQVLRGLGDGRFVSQSSMIVGRNDSLVTADIDRDGRMDAAVLLLNGPVSRLQVLWGNGNGTFRTGPVTNLPGGLHSAGSLAVGDVNRDGQTDIVVARTIANTVITLLGNGDGTFRTGSSINVVNPGGVALSDLNGDSQLDLAVTRPSQNSVSIYRGNGLGGFTASQELAVGSSPRSVLLSDLNADGYKDVIVANSNSGNITVWEGRAGGTFEARRDFSAGPSSLGSKLFPTSIALGDFNRDGRMDLAVGHGNTAAQSRQITVLTAAAPIVGNPGRLQVDSSSYSVNEGAGTATVRVTRTGGSAGTVSVDYITVGWSDRPGYATGASDFAGRMGRLTFAPGETSKTITVSILDDQLVEGPEKFGVNLYNVTGGAELGTTSYAEVTIVDNERAGRIQFDSASYSFNEAAGTATVRVTRTDGSDGTVSVDYITVGWSDRPGYATGASDFAGQMGRLTFAPGETSKTITVSILDDQLIEGPEKFGVNLSNVTGGAELGTTSYTEVTILDNDKPNLKVTSVYLTDASGNRLNSLNDLYYGMPVYVQVEFNTQDLPAGTSYTLTQTINGVTREFTLNWGAGMAGTGYWVHRWYGFAWNGQQQTVDVTLDAANQIDEVFENDNFQRLIAMF